MNDMSLDMNQTTIGTIIFALLMIGLVVVAAMSPTEPKPVLAARDTCVQHENLAGGMHIHPRVEIYNGEEKVAIPAEIGIASECMKAVHTHDSSGELHLEYPSQHDFVLGDFFANWGQPFSKDQILDFKADAEHQVTLEVDGQMSEDYGNLILKDNQNIVIRYQRIGS